MTDKNLTLSEYGKANNIPEDELVILGMQSFGWDENSIRLMLAIERNETKSDVIEVGQ